MISVGDLRPGTTFEYEGNLYVVLDYSHNKTARAAANIRIKMKNLRSGSTTEVTFGGNDKVKKAHVTATGATKNAVIETGYQIKVPLFISEGEVVIVNTVDGKYQGRA